MTDKSDNRQYAGIRRAFSLFDTFLGVITRLFITLFLLGFVVTLVLLMTGGPAPRVPEKAVLVWAPQGTLVDESESERASTLGRYFFGEQFKKTQVADLVTVLNRAANDSRIKMAVLRLEDMGAGGMAQLQELTAAIRNFETKGKSVIASSLRYTQPQYLLAAQAQKVYLDPIGDIELKGFGLYQHYFKELLDKFGISVNVSRVGKYKSAAEPFIRADMSLDAREENTAWLDTLWNIYKTEVATGRRFQPDVIDRYVGHYVEELAAQNGDAAQAALKAGLVDKLATDEELQQELGKLVGIDPDTGAYWQIDDRDYLRATNAERATARSSKIGLIVISGPIVEGESWSGVAGADTIADLIRSGYKNEDIAALVLRINSPGGSLYASEKIRRQVLAAREAGKPIVVSMSSMATSGGYWVAVNANQIWAEDSTITGSIGIFSLQLSVNQLMERLGVNTDSVETTPWAGAMRFDRPLSPDAKRVIQLQVNHGYDRFVTLVSEGRGLSVEAVKQIAQGRVWTGRDAIRIGLVDQVGGLDAATKSAARLAGIAEGQYALVPIRPPQKLLKQLFDRAVKVNEQTAFEEMLPAWFQQRIRRFGANLSLGWMNDEKGIYAFCPCQPDLGAGTE